jgi:hypothetical protein
MSVPPAIQPLVLRPAKDSLNNIGAALANRMLDCSDSGKAPATTTVAIDRRAIDAQTRLIPCTILLPSPRLRRLPPRGVAAQTNQQTGARHVRNAVSTCGV